MAQHWDEYDNSLVLDGFENGIADSPFSGIADLRNVNIISVPGEASVSFSTSQISPSAIANGSVTSGNAGTYYLTYTGSANLENGMAIYFSASSSLGVTNNIPYWINNLSSGTFQITSDYQTNTIVHITNGTGTFVVYGMGIPNYFVTDGKSNYFMLDSLGQVWSNVYTTTSGYWTYTGNRTCTSSNGNGLVYYQASDGTGYVFVFNNSSIDYTKSTNIDISWYYQWTPTTGVNAGYNASATAILNTPLGTQNSHEALVGQDNTVYYCDANFVGSWFEKPTKVFSPVDTSTYTYAKQALQIPTTDNAKCLAELGVNLLVGGWSNKIYPWNRTSTSYTYPIWIAESVISKMITVNTNTYIFAGNRGRIYITNGSQAMLYKKVPDHISGVVEPYFTWGGVCSTRNQLYFGFYVISNGGTELSGYGGVWAIDMDTKAIRQTNTLSYDTGNTKYGYANALIPVLPNVNSPGNPVGIGMYIGWKSSYGLVNPTYGIDKTSSSPYIGSQATIDFDLIPVGTYDKPRNFSRAEYRLNKPLISGESVTLNYRTDFSQSWTAFLTDSTAGHYSLSGNIGSISNVQWLQIQAVLNSKVSSPSYVRLREVRLKV